MQVDVNITKSDLIWLNMSKIFRMTSNIVLFVIILSLVTISIWLGARSDPDGVDWIALVFASVTSSLLAFAGLFVFSLLFVVAGSTVRAGVTGKHSYTIEAAGLREVTAANEALIFWPAIKKVEKSSRAILVQINEYLFHILPRRDFESDDQFEAFHQSLVERCPKAG